MCERLLIENRHVRSPHEFRPEAMLPLWFVSDDKLFVRKIHDPLGRALLPILQDEFHELSNLQELNDCLDSGTIPLWAGLRTGCANQWLTDARGITLPERTVYIWELLLNDDDLKYICVLLAFLQAHYSLIEEFNNTPAASRSLDDLIIKLSNVNGGSDTAVYGKFAAREKAGIRGYAHVSQDIPEGGLRAGVRIVVPEGLSTTVEEMPCADITCAWRLRVNWRKDTIESVSFDGMQPAFTESEQRRLLQRRQIWFQANTVMHHVIGEGINDIGSVLDATLALAQTASRDELLKETLKVAFDNDENLQTKVKSCRNLIPQTANDHLEAFAMAAETVLTYNQEHRDYLDLMRFLNQCERSQDRQERLTVQDSQRKKGKPFVFSTEQEAENDVTAILMCAFAPHVKHARTMMEGPAAFRERPLVVRFVAPWRAIEFPNGMALTFVFRTLLANAVQYSSKEQSYELTLKLHEDGRSLEVNLANDLDVLTLEEAGKDIVTCARCNSPQGDLFHHGDSGDILCSGCLRKYYSERLESDKRGRLLVEYIVSDHWGGKPHPVPRILQDWESWKRRKLQFGFTVPMGDFTWKYV